MLFFTSTLTPFDPSGKVDLGRLRAHVLWLAMQGVDGFVSGSTAGELPYLTDREREAVHRTVLDAARGRPVYPCVWDPSPTTTAYLADAAKEQGATGLLVPPPLYYPLDERLVEAWYRGLAERTELPLIAHHDPDHIPTALEADLYARLRADEVLAGIEDDSGDLFRLRRLARRDPGTVYAGDDRVLSAARAVPELAGVISVAANVWPSLCLRVYRKGETQLEDAYLDRIARVRSAGGHRALKALLGMHARAPLLAPSTEVLKSLPSPELP